jgi:hypothetical protein
MFSLEQKRLIFRLLWKERKKFFSKEKGSLLDKTISDVSQLLLNEKANDLRIDSSLDYSTRRK